MILSQILGVGAGANRKQLNSGQTGFGFVTGKVSIPADHIATAGNISRQLSRFSLYPSYIDSYERKVKEFNNFQPQNKTPTIKPFLGSRDTSLGSSWQGDLLFFDKSNLIEYFALDTIPAFVYDDGTVVKNLPLLGYKQGDFVSLSDNPDVLVVKLDSDCKDMTAVKLDFSQSPTAFDLTQLWTFADDFDTLANWTVVSGDATVDNGVLILNAGQIVTNDTVITGTGNLNSVEFSEPNVFGYLIELDLQSIGYLKIGFSTSNSSYTSYISISNYANTVQIRIYSNSYTENPTYYLPLDRFKQPDGTYKLYILFFYVVYYYTVSTFYPTAYYYGYLQAVATTDLRYADCILTIAGATNRYKLPSDYYDCLLKFPYDKLYASYSDIYIHYSRYTTNSLDVPFNTDSGLYLFLEGTANIDAFKIRPIVDLKRVPVGRIFTSYEASDDEFYPKATSEVQETYNRFNKNFNFVQETSNPVENIVITPEKITPPKTNPHRILRTFRRSIAGIQPATYPEQSFAYNQAGYTIFIEKKGRSSIEMTYDVPLGKYVRIVFPCYMLVGDVPKNFRINGNIIEGWVIYDEQITFSVTDEVQCVYNVTLNPVNYAERT